MKENFKCSLNKDVDEFLKNKAISFELKSVSRTYLILDEYGLILGYFSLSFKDVTLDTAKISNTKIKNLDGFSKRATSLKAYLIGQIGKNNLIADNPICLNSILNEIYSVIIQAQSLVGGRVIILECENNDKLISLYEDHGYTILDVVDDSDLKTMYIAISNIQSD